MRDSTEPVQEDWDLELDGNSNQQPEPDRIWRQDSTQCQETARLIAQESVRSKETSKMTVQETMQPKSLRVCPVEGNGHKKDHAGMARIFGLSVKSLNVLHGVTEAGKTVEGLDQWSSLVTAPAGKALATRKFAETAPDSVFCTSASGKSASGTTVGTEPMQNASLRPTNSSPLKLDEQEWQAAHLEGLHQGSATKATPEKPSSPDDSQAIHKLKPKENPHRTYKKHSLTSSAPSRLSSGPHKQQNHRQREVGSHRRRLPSGCRRTECRTRRAESDLPTTGRGCGRHLGQMKSQSESATVVAEYWDDELTNTPGIVVQSKAARVMGTLNSESPVPPSPQEMFQDTAEEPHEGNNANLSPSPERLLPTSNADVNCLGRNEVPSQGEVGAIEQPLSECESEPDSHSFGSANHMPVIPSPLECQPKSERPAGFDPRHYLPPSPTPEESAPQLPLLPEPGAQSAGLGSMMYCPSHPTDFLSFPTGLEEEGATPSPPLELPDAAQSNGNSPVSSNTFAPQESLGEWTEADEEDSWLMDSIPDPASQESFENPELGDLVESERDVPTDDAACVEGHVSHVVADSDPAVYVSASAGLGHRHPYKGRGLAWNCRPQLSFQPRTPPPPGFRMHTPSRLQPDFLQFGHINVGDSWQDPETHTQATSSAAGQASFNSPSLYEHWSVYPPRLMHPPGSFRFGNTDVGWRYPGKQDLTGAKADSDSTVEAGMPHLLTLSPRSHCQEGAKSQLEGATVAIARAALPPPPPAKRESPGTTSSDMNNNQKTGLLG